MGLNVQEEDGASSKVLKVQNWLENMTETECDISFKSLINNTNIFNVLAHFCHGLFLNLSFVGDLSPILGKDGIQLFNKTISVLSS